MSADDLFQYELLSDEDCSEEEVEDYTECVRIEDFVERFGRFIKTRESTKFFKIRDDSISTRPVAELYVRFLLGRFTIAKIMTFEEFQRRGIARKIVRLAKDLCALHRCTARVECVQSDILASLLRSESFKAVPDSDHYDWQNF